MRCPGIAPVTAREDADDAAARVGTEVLCGRFTLRELIEPEKPAVGSPAIWHADGPAADFLLKAWSRGGVDDVAVKAV